MPPKHNHSINSHATNQMSGAASNTPRTRASTRSKTPLPTVATRQSYTYGSRGKVSLDQQTTTSTSAMARHFNTRTRASTPRRTTRAQSAQLSDAAADDAETSTATGGHPPLSTKTSKQPVSRIREEPESPPAPREQGTRWSKHQQVAAAEDDSADALNGSKARRTQVSSKQPIRHSEDSEEEQEDDDDDHDEAARETTWPQQYVFKKLHEPSPSLFNGGNGATTSRQQPITSLQGTNTSRQRLKNSLPGTSTSVQDLRPDTSLQGSAVYVSPRSQAQQAFTASSARASGIFSRLVTTLWQALESFTSASFWRSSFWPRLKTIIWVILITHLVGTFFAWVPVFDDNLEIKRDNFFYNVRNKIGITDRGFGIAWAESQRRWQDARHKKFWIEELPDYNMPTLQWEINRSMAWRMKDADTALEALQTQVGLHNESITELQRTLPDMIAVEHVNGEWEISGRFWKALAQKMQSEEAAPLWEEFLRTNSDLVHSIFKEAAQDGSRHGSPDYHVLDKDKFQIKIAENNAMMEERFDAKLRSLQAHVINEIKTVATQTAQNEARAHVIGRGQVAALAHANLLKVLDDRMRQVNYFSTGLNAVIHPGYTSPTFGNIYVTLPWYRKLWWETGYSKVQRTWASTANKPIHALTPWEEGTQCWCAAPSTDEKALAQLTVQMQHKVHPDEIIIEHIPATGTLDIAAAPKNFEVWAQVDNATIADSIQGWTRTYALQYLERDCGAPPDNSGTWVCARTGTYDIHGSIFVQAFPMPWGGDTRALASDRVAVRVVENYGADHTCIYRVRMTGSPA